MEEEEIVGDEGGRWGSIICQVDGGKSCKSVCGVEGQGWCWCWAMRYLVDVWERGVGCRYSGTMAGITFVRVGYCNLCRDCNGH